MEKDIKRIEQSERVKRLVKSDDFKDLLSLLALLIKELDTVRNVDNIKSSYKDIAIEQSARKRAIEIIEQWLDDVLGIVNYSQFIEDSIEKTDDILKRFKE